MAGPPNPRLQRRIERFIRLAAPVLDVALVVGDGVSRLFTREEPGNLPARMARPGQAAPRGLRRQP